MKRRQAFTLVELMVSMALIIFIMAILSQAFIAALGVFRDLKGQGDLAEKLRSTMQILQRDLGAYHFESTRRLSDPTFWNSGPPQQGFFQVWQNSVPSSVLGSPCFIEGYDLDIIPPPVGTGTGIGSYRTVDHALAFTVKLSGNNMGDFMSASALGSGNVWTPPPPLPYGAPVVPQLPGNPPPNSPINPGQGLGIGAIQFFGPQESRYQPILGAPNVSGYNYQWAEVEWFLKPQVNPSTLQPDFTEPDPSSASLPVPLFQLYRRQRLLVPDNNLVALSTTPIGGVPYAGVPFPLIGNFLEMSCLPSPAGTPMIYFNSPADVTVPQRRLGGGIPANFTTIAQDVANPAIGNNNPALAGLIGSDIQLNDVVSFDVRLLTMNPLIPPNKVGIPPSPDPFVMLSWPSPTSVPASTNNPFTNGTFTYTTPALPPPTWITGATGMTGWVFDTWSSLNDGVNDYSQWNLAGTTTGPKIPFWSATQQTYQYPFGNGLGQTITTPQGFGTGPIIRAVQITIRIWDFKTSQTRQVTIVQAM